ncbi:ankyrin repeat-containing protein [Histomonas meleagridis]|uniref:ankyrin repeat-containing protein n=1 Tax=Histomonas meleagridis TaxID=135588 RepID=UPI0035598D04|nr:ankyrin repeat-containing protein [Histomonas meleagridis]KAH0806412.1 ankyrin repeat-containing protein [Histomonas meleagridis]
MDNLSLIHIAALANCLEIFLYCENAIGLSITTQSAESFTPIYYAAINNSLEVFAYIVSKDPSQAKDPPRNQLSLIKCAVVSKAPEILELLFYYGAKLGRENVIQLAIQKQNIRVLKLLLLNSESQTSEKTPLMIAAFNSYSGTQCIKLLLESGENPNEFRNNKCAFYIACESDQVDVAMLLAQCTRKFETDYLGKSAIHYLCILHNIEVMKVVLEKGINVNREDENGRLGPFYMIDIVSTDEFIKIMELLMKYGFDINTKTSGDPLIASIENSIMKPVQLVQWLIQHGADLNMMVPSKKMTLYKLLSNSQKFKNLPEVVNWIPEENEVPKKAGRGRRKKLNFS